MFRKLYSYYSIENIGEREVDRLLSAELPYLKGNWYLQHNYLLRNHPTKKEGECDFLLFNSQGLIVIEVKGSQVKFENNTFYQYNRRYSSWERKENPFSQARHNADAISKILKENKIEGVFVAHIVVFPESIFPAKKQLLDDFWAMDSDESLGTKILNSINEQIKRSKRDNYSNLSSNKMEFIANLFSPKISESILKSQLKLSDSESKRMESNNFKILDGLSENRRVIIEGPPGSIKSLYALEMGKKRLKDSDSKLLYICWNELLASYINFKLNYFGLAKQSKAMAYYPYLIELMSAAGIDKSELSSDKLSDSKNIRTIYNKAIGILETLGMKPIYDYIIIDEAQDLFDKGLDDLLTKQSGDGKKGLENGSYIVFYDNADGFKSVKDRDTFTFTLEYLKDNAAIYRLNENTRHNSNDGLKEFIEAVNRYDFNFKKDYGSDVKIYSYGEIDEIMPLLKTTVKEVLKTCAKQDLVVLFTSNLVSGKIKKDRLLDKFIESDKSFEKITSENICEVIENVKYTTALTYKGLQRDVVILVVNNLFEEQGPDLLHQLLIGVSRSRLKLHILVDNNSIRD